MVSAIGIYVAIANVLEKPNEKAKIVFKRAKSLEESLGEKNNFGCCFIWKSNPSPSHGKDTSSNLVRTTKCSNIKSLRICIVE